MSEIDELMAQVPLDQVARQLGVGDAEARTATRSALTALLGGMAANAADPGGETSLTEALAQHGGELDGGYDVTTVDVDDGGRIVDHVFGDSRDQVVDRLSGTNQAGGLGGGLLAKLLPMLAPLVMAWLSKKLGGALGGGGQPDPAPSGGGSTRSDNPGVRDILDDILGPGGRPRQGGGSTAAPAQPEREEGQGGGFGGLGDILGDLLGQGRRS